MKKKLLKAALVILVGTGFIACKKEAQSEEKTTVTPGPGLNEFLQRGPNGSVVIYSGWITKTQADWTGFGSHEIQTNIASPSLSDAVRNSGIVMVYFEFDGKVRALPYTWFDDVYLQTVDYNFVVQNINVVLRLSGNVISGIGELRFRYVLIPGTQSGGRMANTVDYNDYDAVCNYYGIAK